MFDEERLDPHGVGYLPHVLTVKGELSVHIADVLTNFRSISGQTKEGAGNILSYLRRTCGVAECVWKEVNITNVCDCNRARKQ